MSFSVSGDKEIIKALKGIAGNKGKAAIRKATRAGMKPQQAKVKSAVRKLTGALRKSVKVRALKRSRVRQGHAVRMGGMGFGKEPFYGAFQEWGTQKVKASEAMTKVAEQNASQTINTTQAIIGAEIDKIWAG